VVLGDLSDKHMTDEDVVDQFLASSVDSAESLLGRDARGEVPKPLRVTVVGAVKASGADLRAGRPVDDLSGGPLPRPVSRGSPIPLMASSSTS